MATYDLKLPQGVDIPDGKYTGKWLKYEITFRVNGEDIVGKCDSGRTEDYSSFCVVVIKNGKAIIEDVT